MRSRIFLVSVVASAAAWLTASSAAAVGGALSPIGRLPFPERGYVVDVPSGAVVVRSAIHVRENGRRVRGLVVAPLGAARVRAGVVLALDASDSMAGSPEAAVVAAGRSFVARGGAASRIGVVAFNGAVRVVQRPTSNRSSLGRALESPPTVAYGTRIYDAVVRSLQLLAAARVSTGSIVLLSDGADIGSSASLEGAVARARAQHVRVFTVGLRSSSFDPAPLRELASRTGGTYVEAATLGDLAPVYEALGRRLAGEYVIRYRSDAAPGSHVVVRVDVDGLGASAAAYVAPKPAGVAPFHRSFLARFLLAPGSAFGISLLVALLVAIVITSFARPRSMSLVDRIEQFAGGGDPEPAPAPVRVRLRRDAEQRFLSRLERDLEIARIEMPAPRFALLTAAATMVLVVLLFLIAPIFAIVGLATPFAARAYVNHRLRQVRDVFADQLPPNLQVLASALRVGHSFIAALSVVVENAHEPSRSELQRVIVDEQLGVTIEDAIRRVAVRMASHDLEQVALLAELQRTAGGNTAEVLDVVVDTLRERGDLRRLVRTLTAQGRLARWILSALPIAAAVLLALVQPTAIMPLLHSGIGQAGLVLAALLVGTGSLVIQKIVDIEV
jgi:tight adherence protein B